MEKVRQLVHTHQDKFKFVLFAGAGIAAFNTLARPDFNLIIYLYLFYVWNNMNDSKETQTSEKVFSFFALAYSLIIDFVWCFFWGSRWGGKNDSESFIHSMVIFFSWMGILVKVLKFKLDSKPCLRRSFRMGYYSLFITY
jgi:hypothetical protein